MKRIIDVNDLDAIARDLETVTALLHDAAMKAGTGTCEADEWPATEDRLVYLIERLGEHVAALRKLTEPPEHVTEQLEALATPPA